MSWLHFIRNNAFDQSTLAWLSSSMLLGVIALVTELGISAFHARRPHHCIR